MSEDENIKSYVQRLDEIVAKMRGLGAIIDETRIVKKIIKTLLDAYSEKVSSIEHTIIIRPILRICC